MSSKIETEKVQAFVNDLYKQLGAARAAISNGPRGVNVTALNEVDKAANIVALFEEDLKKTVLFKFDDYGSKL